MSSFRNDTSDLNSPIQRFSPVICMAALVLTPILVFFAFKAQASNSNNVRDWLPKKFEATQRLKWYIQRFGTDEVLAVSWKDCTLDDARLDQFAENLRQPRQDSKGVERPLFRDVFSGRSVQQQLLSEPLSLDEDESHRRLEGWIVGKDGKTTCAIAIVGPDADGSYDRHGAVRAAKEAAASLGIAETDLQIAGPTADAVAIDQAGTENIAQLGIIAAIWGAFLAWVCLRDVTRALIVFISAKICWATSLSLVYFSGQNMDAVLMSMPALVFVLAISGAIHLTHYFRNARSHASPSESVNIAFREGRLPCALACATTALGMGSLAISAVTPVVRFGTFAALGTLAVLVVLLFVWPALTQFSLRWRIDEPRNDDSRWWKSLEHLVIHRWQLVLIAFAIALPFCFVGLSQLETSVRLNSLLPKSSNLLQSYEWFQDSIGPIVPMEIVLEFPEPDTDGREMLHRARFVEHIRKTVSDFPETGGTIAATTFSPVLPEQNGARQVTIRRIVANKLAKNRDLFEKLHFIKEHEGSELWRVSTRVATGGSVDYGTVLDKLETSVASAVSESESFQKVNYRICGGVPLIYMAQQQLLVDLQKSFLTAFLLIALVMALLLRRASGGIVSMIPNVFPTLLVFGIMGLFRTPIDIGTMMTASVALGIAVDDTLHFVVWFRRGMEEYDDRNEAIRHAFYHCATAMLHTSVICGLGMLPFVFSSFQPIARFSGVLCALLFAALLGDLVLLPALLASPLGKFIAPSHSTTPELVTTS